MFSRHINFEEKQKLGVKHNRKITDGDYVAGALTPPTKALNRY